MTSPGTGGRKPSIKFSEFLEYCNEKIFTNLEQETASSAPIQEEPKKHYKISDELGKQLHNLAFAIIKKNLGNEKIGIKAKKTVVDKTFDIVEKINSWNEIKTIIDLESLKTTHSQESINTLAKIYNDWVENEKINSETQQNNLDGIMENEATATILKVVIDNNEKLRDQVENNYALVQKKLPWNLTEDDKKNTEVIQKIKELESNQQETSAFSFLTDIPLKKWLIGGSILAIFVFFLIFIWRKFLDNVI